MTISIQAMKKTAKKRIGRIFCSRLLSRAERDNANAAKEIEVTASSLTRLIGSKLDQGETSKVVMGPKVNKSADTRLKIAEDTLCIPLGYDAYQAVGTPRGVRG